MSNKISVVIPNYNGSSLLLRNLPSVINNFPKCQIIVADDASTDDSLNILTRNFPSVKVIANPVNKGFSSNINSGISVAKTDILVLLNTDVSIPKNYTKDVLAYFEDSELFGLGFQDRSHENKQIVLRGRGIGKFEKGLLSHAKGENVAGNTLWVSGGSCALSREKFVKLNGFNPIYNPFYWEDIDLSYRALKTGWKLKFAPEIVVDHMHETGSIKTHNKEAKIVSVSARNMFIFSAKNLTDKDLLFDFYLNLILLFGKSLIKRDGVIIKSIISFFLKLPKVLGSRLKEKRLYKLSDKQVIELYGR